MKLLPPFIIGPRLLPALRIGDATLSLATVQPAKGTGPESRIMGPRYGATFFLDFADGTEYECSDMQSGCGGFGSAVAIFETFLSFLSAAAEARNFTERTGRESDNDDMFPEIVMAWAAANQSAIECAQCDIQDETGAPCAELILE